MAIDRTQFNTWVDSNGTPGSGTPITKTKIATDILDPIDDAIAAVGGGVRASVYHATTQSLSTGVETAILFDSEEFDTNTMHSTVSNTSRLTATVDGIYLLSASVHFDSGSTGSRVARFRKNGSTGLSGISRSPAIAGDPVDLCIQVVVELVAGDYVEVMATHNQGSSLNVSHASMRHFQNSFQMVLLGPS